MGKTKNELMSTKNKRVKQKLLELQGGGTGKKKKSNGHTGHTMCVQALREDGMQLGQGTVKSGDRESADTQRGGQSAEVAGF